MKTKKIDYQDGGTKLTGLLAWDSAAPGRRPGVLVVHEWWGLTDHARRRAQRLAAEGYAAFALDMYGDGRATDDAVRAEGWRDEVIGDPAAWIRRADCGLQVLKDLPQVDGDRLAAIGYCFGGATVMQMAYARCTVKAVASFHGSLPLPPADCTKVDARVFAAHGRDDAFIPLEQVAAFQAALDRVGAPWQMNVYSDTRHSFTNPEAGRHGMENLQYNARADRDSWAAMLLMFGEVFGGR